MDFEDIEAPPESFSNSNRKNGEEASQKLVSGLFQMTTQVKSLRRLAALIGTSKDSLEIREKIQRLRQQLSTLARQTGNNLKEVQLQAHKEISGKRKQLSDAKLARDVEAVLKEFQSAQRFAADRESLSYKRFRREVQNFQLSEEVKPLTLEENRELVLVENELVYNEAVIDERDEGIREIQQEIGEVHEIFKDLATLVKDQGTLIDDFEAKIESANTDVQRGNKQLSGALKKQKTANSLTCWAMVIFSVAMFILFLVLSS